MANYNLTNQPISSSFGQLLQKDVTTSTLYDGTGSVVSDLDITSSYALTASYAENVDDPTWDEIQNKPSGLVSGSSQIILEDTTGNLSGSRIEGAVALATNSVSASIANSATTALLATSASHAEVADEVPYSGVTGKPTLVSGSSQVSYTELSNIPSGIVSGSSQVSYPELSNIPSGIVSGSSQVNLTDTTFVDGTEFMVLRTDGAGNLSFDYADRAQIEIRTDESIVKGDPLYVTGFSDGQNRVTVGKADASDPSKMPAYGVAYESVSQNTNTQMVALGTLQNINTQTPNYNVGDTLYVAVGGGLTNVKPTGTNLIQNVGIVGRRNQNNGEILVSAIGRSNDLPNIPQGQAWVGDSNGVPQAISTASWDAQGDLTQLNQFTQSQEIYNTGINSYTASNDIRVGDIETYVTSSSQRLDLLEDFTGSQQALNTTFATTGSNTFVGNQVISGSLTIQEGNPITATQIELTEAIIAPGIESTTGTLTSYSNLDVSGSVNVQGNIVAVGSIESSTLIQQNISAPTTNQEKAFINVSGASVNGRSYNRVFYGMADYPSFGTQFEDYFAIEYYNATGLNYNFGSEFNLNGSTAVIQTKASGSGNISKVQTLDDFNGNSVVNLTSPNQVQISTPETAMTGNLILVGNLISPTGTTTIANNTVVSGSTATEVKPQTITSTTASIDFSSTSMFELTLGSGVDTHVDATNVGKGQTINLLITQDASTAGTVSFSPKFLQPSGSEYTPTTTLGGKDILTLVTFSDTNSVYVAAVNEMI